MEIGKAKAEVAKLAKSKGIDVQSAWDIFFFDEVLLRLSKSKYRKSFVIKGGFYLQSIVGVETRSTMDIDFKFIGNELSADELKRIFTEICVDSNEDNISFEIISVDDITAETKYGGKTIKVDARFFNIRKRFGIDIGIGDVVTPYPIEYEYGLSFKKDEDCKLLAYTIESMMAEKFETLISKGMQNSRSKDLLDLYLLSKENYDIENLNVAMINTFNLRGTEYSREKIIKLLDETFGFDRIRFLYENYSKKNAFAKEVTFDMCRNAVYALFQKLHFERGISLSDYDVELDLLRHGESEHDKLGGWSDSHLTENGKKDIEELLLKIEKHDLFISSDLNRARETSEIINGKLGMDIIYDEGFREMNNGGLKDMSKLEFENLSEDYRFSSLEMNQRYPGGESPNEFYERVKGKFLGLLEQNRGKKILLVTHAGVITVILCILNGYKYSNKLRIAPHVGCLMRLH